MFDILHGLDTTPGGSLSGSVSSITSPSVPEDKTTPDVAIPPEVLWKAWKKTPTPQNSVAMLNSLDSTIDRAIQSQTGTLDPVLKGKARVMTMDAMERYDPSKGKLVSHLYNHLQGLKRYSAQMGAGVHIPERLSLDRQMVRLAKQELNDRLGREPTEDELADRTGMSPKRLEQIRGVSPAMSEGYFSSLGDEGEGGFMPAVRGTSSPAWEKLVMAEMHPIDQKIIEYHRMGLQNGRIAEKLRISPGRVSQRKQVIQRMLDQEDSLSPF
jgi:hypothetical protein